MLKTKINDSVQTPVALLKELNKEFHFDFDPCPLNDTPDFDGLLIPWGRSNFVNPPYSNIGPWVEKGLSECALGKKSVFLITVKTNTVYWRELIFPFASEIRFIHERIKFEGYDTPFPLALALVIFDPKTLQKKQYRKRIECENYSYTPM